MVIDCRLPIYIILLYYYIIFILHCILLIVRIFTLWILGNSQMLKQVNLFTTLKPQRRNFARSTHSLCLTKYVELNNSLLNTCKWHLLNIKRIVFNGQLRRLLVLWNSSPKERSNGLSGADYIWLKGLLTLFIRYKTRFSSTLLLNLRLMVTLS